MQQIDGEQGAALAEAQTAIHGSLATICICVAMCVYG
jgi:hypothetical protein